MAKILLIDFAEEEANGLLHKKIDVERKETNWKSGKSDSLVPPPDCRIIFYQTHKLPLVPSLHMADTEHFDLFIHNGGAAVCFVGEAREYHLTNIFGPVPGLKIAESTDPAKITVSTDTAFQPLFSSYGKDIQYAAEMFTDNGAEAQPFDSKEGHPRLNGQFHTLAMDSSHHPVAGLVKKGKGFLALLPWFGGKNLEVTEFLLREVLPKYSPQLFDEEGYQWMESYEYYFPKLKDIFQQIEQETERYRRNIRLLKDKIEDIKKMEQEPFNRLLKSQAEELKTAVQNAFSYLEWPNVVDVDSYWKRVIRIKEEDLWLLDESQAASLEINLRKNPMLLVVLKGGAGPTPDSDFDILQKYKGRRMQEFDNTKMKSILIGNYFCKEDARSRPNPFSDKQIEEAVSDKNGLLTTYELFKVIKAEKEHKISKQEIRNQMNSKVGLITFDY